MAIPRLPSRDKASRSETLALVELDPSNSAMAGFNAGWPRCVAGIDSALPKPVLLLLRCSRYSATARSISCTCDGEGSQTLAEPVRWSEDRLPVAVPEVLDSIERRTLPIKTTIKFLAGRSAREL